MKNIITRLALLATIIAMPCAVSSSQAATLPSTPPTWTFTGTVDVDTKVNVVDGATGIYTYGANCTVDLYSKEKGKVVSTRAVTLTPTYYGSGFWTFSRTLHFVGSFSLTDTEWYNRAYEVRVKMTVNQKNLQGKVINTKVYTKTIATKTGYSPSLPTTISLGAINL